MNVYQMAVNNVARAIRAQPVRDEDPEPKLTVFRAAEILSIAFCKSEDDVIADLTFSKE